MNFLWQGVTLSKNQELLLELYLGIILSGLRILGIEPWVAACKANVLPTMLSLRPVN